MRPRKNTRFGLSALLLLVAALVLLAGCGGGSDEGEGTAGQVASGGATREGAENGESEGANNEAPNGSPSGSDGASPGSGGEAAGDEGGSSGEGAGATAGGKAKGGGESGSNPAQAGAPKGGAKKYIAAADAICLKWGSQIKVDAQKGYSGDLNGSKKQIQEGIQALARGVEKYVIGDLETEQRQLEGLKASTSDAQEAEEAAVSALQKLIDLAKSDPEALIVGNSEQAKEAEALTKPQGFHACGNIVGNLT